MNIETATMTCPSWCAEHQELDGEFVGHSRPIETVEGVWVELHQPSVDGMTVNELAELAHARGQAPSVLLRGAMTPYLQLDASTARLTAADARTLATALVEAAGLLEGR